MWMQFKKIIWWRDKKLKKKFFKKQIRKKIEEVTHDEIMQLAYESAEETKPHKRKRKHFTDWIYFLKTKWKPKPEYLSIEQLMYKHIHWPKCKICEDKFAPYNMYICTLCQEAIERLRK